LTKSLNIALKKSKGKYIARMDSDDICMPNRFKLQLEFMMKNPSIGVCGSDVMMISESGKHLYNLKLPKNDNDIKTMLILGNQIVHPSVIIRKSVLDNNKITYDESFKTCQDYKLWSDLIDKTQFNNLSDQLLKYRIVNSGITSIQQKKRNEKKNIIYSIYQSLNKNGRLMLDDEQLQILSEFSTRFDKITNTDIKRSIIDIYSSLIKEYKYRHMDYKSFCNKFSELWVWHDGIKTWNNSTLLLNCKGIIMNMKVNFIIAKMKLLS
jgi:Glycosyl transferase family 2.